MRVRFTRCRTGPLVQHVPSLRLRRLPSLPGKSSRTQKWWEQCQQLRLALQQKDLEKEKIISKRSKPLRILFCGSDEFSCASLRALVDLRLRNPKLIKSIDVMIRPGKPSGRSMKTVREVPLKAVAERFGLQIHERDTFTGWELPLAQGQPINLIVAVSFGLFVPPRILRAAAYGGINVHPSLLPNLRGPAPIHHTILAGVRSTGVTVQTLHEKTFDHGMILSQSRHVAVTDKMKYADLHKILAPMGGRMLADSLERDLHTPPLKDISPNEGPKHKILHAPKVTSLDRKIDFEKRHRIMRQYQALGRLWADICIDGSTSKRCVFEDFKEVDFNFTEEMGPDKTQRISATPNFDLDSTSEPPPAHFRVIVSSTPAGIKVPMFYVESGDDIIIAARGRRKGYAHSRRGTLRVSKITVAGQPTKSAAAALRSIQKAGKWIIARPATDKDLLVKLPKVSLFKSEVKGFTALTRDAKKSKATQYLNGSNGQVEGETATSIESTGVQSVPKTP